MMIPIAGWVAPFGYPRIKACSRLPMAFRSVPRPSSPPGAKASTECPYRAQDPAHAQEPPTLRIARYFCCAGRLTPLSALPVLTARRPLRSGSRQERHATQHSEVSNDPHGPWTKPERARSSRTHSLLSTPLSASPRSSGQTPNHGHEQERTNLFTLTMNIARHGHYPAG